MKRLTIRTRLTVLYGGLFLGAGVILLALTYVLLSQQLPGAIGFAVTDPPSGVPPQDAVMLADLPIRIREAALEQFVTQGSISLAVVTVVAVGLGWLMAGRALAPLHAITETAGRIARADRPGRGLHERIVLDGPGDEIRELAETFNTMLERLDRSFDGQRRFVGNASHELRTPLAINRALLEVAVSRPGAGEEVRRLGETLLSVNARHERIIDGLLTLADSENEVTARVPVDLAEVAAHVVELASPKLPCRLTLDPAPTAGDPVLLERLVHNLVENAIRHNEPDGWLSVHSGRSGSGVVLTVENTGPVVPRYEVDGLFEPFRRLSGARLAGADRGFGLGLSIVRAVARAHGGRVTAAPRDGGGLRVTVTLPGPVTLSGPVDPA
jgi:signal transduction histidine kinase